MNLFKNDLLTSTMLSEPPPPRSYREPAFARRYGRHRATPMVYAPRLTTMELSAIEQIGDKCVLLDYRVLDFDQAA
ncbi:MAG TPA: hypothetical protein VJ484_09680 [Lysobacter sp.]|nr:hypothetical protein [Lysobacter sp.]